MAETKVLPVVGQYRQEIVEQDGLRWVIGKGTHDSLTVNHEMEPPGASIHDFICRQFRPGRVFLDIGCHVGHYAIRAARSGCQVYAVEANPESAAQLRLNLYINHLREQVTLWSVAAWDRHEPLTYSIAENTYQLRNGSASLASPVSNPVSMGVTVMGCPLDVLLRQVPKVDVVKMDVEGADIRVIDGMMDALCRLRPLLIFESHWFCKTYTPEEMKEREGWLTMRARYKWQDAQELGVKSAEAFRVGIPER